MRQIIDRLEHIAEPPESIQKKLLDLALELQGVSGKKQYGYLKKPLKEKVDAIIQEAERLCLQLEQNKAQTSAEEGLYVEKSSDSFTSETHLQSEILLTSTVRLFHQMGQIFRDNAVAPSNPMGIRADSKRRKNLLQKRLALGHKQDDHEEHLTYDQNMQ